MHRGPGGPAPREESLAVNAQFGHLMKEARESRGWSQRQLAGMLTAVDLKLDPSAITRIERGTRDVKLSEAIAIANVLEISLDLLSYSPEQDFHMREMSQVQMTVRARKALLQALRQIDRWVNATDPDTEEQLLKRRKLSSFTELYTQSLRECGEFRWGGQMGSEGDNFTVYYGPDDFKVKQTLIELVTAGILMSEKEFEEAMEFKLVNQLRDSGPLGLISNIIPGKKRTAEDEDDSDT
ncbi:MAG: multiprotein-bridging factor 1 family protein [Mycolicibacterium sp.]|uniref:helix-turn-helix domain-containing protein n=1 Tax=Mycolicibacterium sp. TaxID=2320850 RepID=UPI003D099F2E